MVGRLISRDLDATDIRWVVRWSDKLEVSESIDNLMIVTHETTCNCGIKGHFDPTCGPPIEEKLPTLDTMAMVIVTLMRCIPDGHEAKKSADKFLSAYNLHPSPLRGENNYDGLGPVHEH